MFHWSVDRSSLIDTRWPLGVMTDWRAFFGAPKSLRSIWRNILCDGLNLSELGRTQSNLWYLLCVFTGLAKIASTTQVWAICESIGFGAFAGDPMEQALLNYRTLCSTIGHLLELADSVPGREMRWVDYCTAKICEESFSPNLWSAFNLSVERWINGTKCTELHNFRLTLS